MGIIIFSMVGWEKKKFFEYLFISNIFYPISVKLKHTDKNQKKKKSKIRVRWLVSCFQEKYKITIYT